MRFAALWQALVRLGIVHETRMDESSQLIPTGRDEYQYIEGKRRLRLQIELLKGDPSRVLYSSTIRRWLPPHQDEPLTEADRKRIALKIADFMRKQGISVVIDDSG
ncbi:MAG: Imm74 family immunity protein [Acidobacteriota bacterium]